MPKRLTEAVIRSLKTAKAQEDILHSVTPSAGVRVTRNGRKTFFIKYRSPTVTTAAGCPAQKRHYFGEHPSGRRGQGVYLTLKEFERAYDVFRGDLARGIDPQEMEPTEDRAPAPQVVRAEKIPSFLRKLFPESYSEGSVAALLAEYFTHDARVHLAPRTLLGYMAAARHVLPVLGKVPYLKLSEDDVRGLLTGVTRTAPQTVREVKKVLSCAYSYGRAHVKGIKHNPCLGVRVTVPKNKRDRWLTDAELQKLLACLPKLNDQKAADVYTLILAAMCRPGEAASARAEDLIVVNGERVWRLPDTKNGRDFLIPLSGPIGEVINRRYLEVGGQGPLFWEYKTDTEYPHLLKKANRALRKLTELENIRPHDFRRSGRTHISMLGVREEVAEALLNHAKDDLKRTYNLYEFWKERKEALALWHAKLAFLKTAALEIAA